MSTIAVKQITSHPAFISFLVMLVKELLFFVRDFLRKRKQKKLVAAENQKRIAKPRPQKLVNDIGDLILQAKIKTGPWKCRRNYEHVTVFLVEFGDLILRHCIGTKVFPSVAIAQAALESAWGAKKELSLFGVKGKGSAGTNIVSTKEWVNTRFDTITDGFRAYNTYDEAVKDYIKLLYTLPRYSRTLKAKTAGEQIGAIHKAGYATDPKYAAKIGKIIKDFNLTYFDRLKKEIEGGSKKAA